MINHPSLIFGRLAQPKFADRLAKRRLKSKEDSSFDIHSPLKPAAGTIEESKEQTRQAYPFHSYAQEYWLFHTKEFKPTRVAGYFLWQRLINEEVKTVKLPWAPKKWDEFGDEYMK